MDDTKPTKRRYFTKTQIRKAFKVYPVSIIGEVEEAKCDFKCFAGKRVAKARRFDVELEDVEIREQVISPAFFKLRICNVPVEEHNVNVLSIRYYFHLEINPNKISIEKVSACVNDANSSFSYVKTILLQVTDKGYGFCAETRCHVADVNEIKECYDKYKWNLHWAPRSIALRIDNYLTNKKGWDWTERSVTHAEVNSYKNLYKYPATVPRKMVLVPFSKEDDVDICCH